MSNLVINNNGNFIYFQQNLKLLIQYQSTSSLMTGRDTTAGYIIAVTQLQHESFMWFLLLQLCTLFQKFFSKLCDLELSTLSVENLPCS